MCENLKISLTFICAKLDGGWQLLINRLRHCHVLTSSFWQSVIHLCVIFWRIILPHTEKKIESIEQTCSQAKLKHLRFCLHQYDQLSRKHLLSVDRQQQQEMNQIFIHFQNECVAKCFRNELKNPTKFSLCKICAKIRSTTDHLPQIH